MEIYTIFFATCAFASIYMLGRGLQNSVVIETVAGAAFALVALAVFFGNKMHIPIVNLVGYYL